MYLKVVYKKFLETKLHLPYISGYLAFREVNPLLNLLNELKSNQPEIYPQVLLIDGKEKKKTCRQKKKKA